MSHAEHEARSRERRGSVAFAVITVSDTRTAETDTGGALLQELLTAAGHTVIHKSICRDDEVADRLAEVLRTPDCEAVALTGGTGLGPRDLAVDLVERLYTARIPGFGELFRMLSWDEIGAGAMLSRASAGVIEGRVIFALPGSRNAIRLAVEKLVAPGAPHLVWELKGRA